VTSSYVEALAKIEKVNPSIARNLENSLDYAYRHLRETGDHSLFDRALAEIRLLAGMMQ